MGLNAVCALAVMRCIEGAWERARHRKKVGVDNTIDDFLVAYTVTAILGNSGNAAKVTKDADFALSRRRRGFKFRFWTKIKMSVRGEMHIRARGYTRAAHP